MSTRTDNSLVLSVKDRIKKQALDNKKLTLTDTKNVQSIHEQFFGKTPDSNLKQLETKSRAYQLAPAYYAQDNTFIKSVIEKMYLSENDSEWFEFYFPLVETTVMRQLTRTLVFDKAIAQDAPPNAPSRFIGTRYREFYNSKEWKGIAVWLSHGFFLDPEGIQLYFDHLENASYGMLQATKLDMWFRLNSLPDPYLEYLSNREYSDGYSLNAILLARSLEMFNIINKEDDSFEKIETATNKLERKYDGKTNAWIIGPQTHKILTIYRPENKRNFLMGNMKTQAGAKNRLEDLSNITQIGTLSSVVTQHEFKISEDEPYQPLEALEIIGQWFPCNDHYLDEPYTFNYKYRDVTIWDNKRNCLVLIKFSEFLKYSDLYNWESEEQELRDASDILADSRKLPTDSTFNRNLLSYDPWLMVVNPNARNIDKRYGRLRFIANQRDNARMGTTTEDFVSLAKTAHRNVLKGSNKNLSQEEEIITNALEVVSKISNMYDATKVKDTKKFGQFKENMGLADKAKAPKHNDRMFQPQNGTLKDAPQNGKNFYDFAGDLDSYPMLSCSEQGLREWSNHESNKDSSLMKEEKKALRSFYKLIDNGVNKLSGTFKTTPLLDKAYTTSDKHRATVSNVFIENTILPSPWNVFVRDTAQSTGFGSVIYSSVSAAKAEDLITTVQTTLNDKQLKKKDVELLLSYFGFSVVDGNNGLTVTVSALSKTDLSKVIKNLAQRNPTLITTSTATINAQNKAIAGSAVKINNSQASLLTQIIATIADTNNNEDAQDVINEAVNSITASGPVNVLKLLPNTTATQLSNALGKADGKLAIEDLQDAWSGLKDSFYDINFSHAFDLGQLVKPSKSHTRTVLVFQKQQFLKYFKSVDGNEEEYNKLPINPTSINNPYTPAPYNEAKRMYDALIDNDPSGLSDYARFIFKSLNRVDNITIKQKYDVDLMPIFQYAINTRKWVPNNDGALLKNRVNKLSHISNRIDEKTIENSLNKDLRRHVKNVSKYTENTSLSGPITLVYLLSKPTGILATTMINDQVNQNLSFIGARPNMYFLAEKMMRVAKNGETARREIGKSLVGVGDHADSDFHYVNYKRPLGAFIKNPDNIVIQRAVTVIGHLYGGGSEFYDPRTKRNNGVEYLDWKTERFGAADEAIFSIPVPLRTSPGTVPNPLDLAGRRLVEPANEKEMADFGNPQEQPPSYVSFARMYGLWGFPINSLTDQYGQAISPDDEDTQMISNTVCYVGPHYTRDKLTGSANGLFGMGNGHFKFCYEGCHDYRYGKTGFDKNWVYKTKVYKN